MSAIEVMISKTNGELYGFYQRPIDIACLRLVPSRTSPICQLSNISIRLLLLSQRHLFTIGTDAPSLSFRLGIGVCILAIFRGVSQVRRERWRIWN